MRILHVGDIAGVASAIARHVPAKSTIITDKPLAWGGQKAIAAYSLNLFRVIPLALAPFYDIVHVHGSEGIGLAIKKLRPQKPVIVHFHGTDIRGKWKEKSRYYNRADKVLVATPDLLQGAPPEVEYLPNPIETDLFYDLGRHAPKTAFTFSYGANKEAQKLAVGLGLELEIHDRTAAPIPHIELMKVFNRFEYYIDLKHSYGHKLEGISRSALEALACGCKVIRYDGAIVEGLPKEHRPESVASRMMAIYESVMRRAGV